ncbi:MAG: M1 family metallopeptidase [Verrucomicrobia bacterium]|nr:M1 family metallopeptidase [Cytophagales bacterium]
MKNITANLLMLSLLLITSIVSAQYKQFARPETDIIHYHFSIRINDRNNQIVATTSVKVKFINPTTKTFMLNLIGKQNDSTGMVVSEVTHRNRKLIFTHQNDLISIQLPDTLNRNVEQFFQIKYSGIPADGLVISQNKFGERTFFGDNWPNRARHWLAVEDHPSDKATCNFSVMAPSHYQVVANGRFKRERNLPHNSKVTEWIESKPIPTKVMVFGAARFAVKKKDSLENIPISYWAYPQDSAKIFFDYAPAKKVMRFFRNKIGRYPFEKLANIQSKTRFGGMENAGCIFYNENLVAGVKNAEIEEIVAHEIAHQWFGNSASEKDWQHIWLSEGFATYFSALYMENEYNKEVLDKTMYENRLAIFRFAAQNPNLPVVDSTQADLMNLLNANSYQKGGWILHMLRYELGDEMFWKVIQLYYQTYQFSNADTEDFRKVVEKVSGRDFSVFFRQWLYGTGYPKVSGTWEYDEKNKKVVLKLKQIQRENLFIFPLEIGFYNADSQLITTQKVTFDNREKSFEFLVTVPPANLTLDPNHWLLLKVEKLEKK